MSDTHVPVAAADLPKKVYEGIKGVDMILHAGDILQASLLDRLAQIAPVRAVCGNMDQEEACAKLPEKDIIKVEDVLIGLIHGRGAPSSLIGLVSKEFKGVNAIVFGHSHQPFSEVKDGILYFNPGSPTDKFFAPYNSYGILEIHNKVIEPAIIRI